MPDDSASKNSNSDLRQRKVDKSEKTSSKKSKGEFKPLVSEAAAKKRTADYLKKSDNELDAYLRHRRQETEAKSERALKIVITIWVTIVLLVLVHIASVINTGYAKADGRPAPKHFLRYVSDPLLPLVDAALEALAPVTSVLEELRLRVLAKLKL